METVFKYILPSLTPAGIVLVVLLLFPEKIEKWSALLWKVLSAFGGIFRSAHKQYLKHDLQGRVNEFVKQMRRDVPGISDESLRVEWVDPDTPRASFIDQNQVILRLRRNDPADHNFVHGAFMFVSSSLLRKPKRYLSPSQREAVDLYVCTKLLEREKASVVGVFLDEYLHPKTEDRKSKTSGYIDDFAIIDQAGLFFSLFLQELGYIGDKVFGRRRDDLIHKDVNNLIEFLKPIAKRRIGDQNDLNFNGEYCRLGIVIIGKPSKLLASIQPYVSYIKNQLVAKDVETIYMLCRDESRDRIDRICGEFSQDYDCVRRLRFSRHLKYDDRREKAKQYLAILRRRGVGVIQSSDAT